MKQLCCCLRKTFAAWLLVGLLAAGFSMSVFADNNSHIVIDPDEYSFSYSGGSGKVTISIGELVKENDQYYAAICFSSTNYTQMRAGDTVVDSVITDHSEGVLPVTINEPCVISGYTVAMSEPHWIDYTITITYDEPVPSTGDLAITNNYSMFKATTASLEVIDGQQYLRIALSGTGYEYLYRGTAEEAAVSMIRDRLHYSLNSDGKYEFLIPTDAYDGLFTISALSAKKNEWYERTIELDQGAMTVTTDKIDSDAVADNPTLPAGDLAITNNYSMFKATTASLEVIDGQQYLRIALSGTGYEYLYRGTAEEAAVSMIRDRLHYSLNSDGKYEFLIPTDAYDGLFTISALSAKKNEWYERTIELDQGAMTVTTDKIDSDAVADSLSILLLPGDLTKIEEEAFAEDPELNIVTASSSLQKIGSGAFRSCTALQRIDLPATVTEIADDAFDGCPLLTICCENGSVAASYAETKGIPYILIQ